MFIGRYDIALGWLHPNDYVHNIIKLGKNDSSEEIYEVLGFQQIEDSWFPKQYKIKRLSYKSKTTGIEDTNITIKSIILNPDHEALRSFYPDDIPNGTITQIAAFSPSIKFTWQDGKLVSGVDRDLDGIDELLGISGEKRTVPESLAASGISDLLEKYKATQDKLQSFVAEGESFIKKVSKKPLLSGNEEKEICEFCFDGSRVNHRRTSWDGRISTKEKPDRTRFIFDGERLIQYRKAQKPENNLVFVSRNAAGENKITATEYEGAALMGFLAGDSDRVDLIRV